MTPKRAIVLGIIASVILVFGQYLYYQGESKVRFYKNGVPLAGAEMVLMGLDSFDDKKVYTLDDQGGHDFGWSMSSFKEKEIWVYVSIKQGTNEMMTSFMRLPSGSKSLDHCSNSILKSTNVVSYFPFISVTSVSETWSLPKNTSASGVSPAKP